jgi:hypothetical protein
VRLTTPRSQDGALKPASAFLSAGFRSLGSCPRAAGWSAATLCIGTKRTCRHGRVLSAIGGKAENICSQRVFRPLYQGRTYSICACFPAPEKISPGAAAFCHESALRALLAASWAKGDGQTRRASSVTHRAPGRFIRHVRLLNQFVSSP